VTALRSSAIVAVLLGGAVTFAAGPKLTTARVPPCSASGVEHERWSMKNRPIPDGHPARLLAFRQLLSTLMPTEAASRNAAQAVSTFEDTLFALDASVCLIKQSPDDCDLHLELAESGAACAHGPRAIVEVPASAGKAVQDATLDAVGLARLGKTKHVFTRPPDVHVVGFGFFDLSHRCTSDPVKGCQHGSAAVATIAELHPAIVEASR